MGNFSKHITGEKFERGFTYDPNTGVLRTTVETQLSGVHPTDGMIEGTDHDNLDLQITADTAMQDPMWLRYWNETEDYRQAYILCEEENLSLEDALRKVWGPETKDNSLFKENILNPDGASPESNGNGQPEIPDGIPTTPYYPREPEPLPEPVKESNPAVGIVITNQKLLLKMAFNLLEQYITDEDKNIAVLTLLKEEAQQLDDIDIVL